MPGPYPPPSPRPFDPVISASLTPPAGRVVPSAIRASDALAKTVNQRIGAGIGGASPAGGMMRAGGGLADREAALAGGSALTALASALAQMILRNRRPVRIPAQNQMPRAIPGPVAIPRK